jgi:protein-S-isoprenylcysteine O-methyltransferase Ste14
MWFLILCWLPFAVLVAAYLCSWPRRPSLTRLLWVDGTVVMLLLIRPFLMYFHPEYFAVDEADLAESRGFMALLIPLWTTVYAIPIVFVAGTVRYFVFRASDANHLTRRSSEPLAAPTPRSKS